MASTMIRRAQPDDLPTLTRIYNHYVQHTAITFDVEPWTEERRADWLDKFAPQGRHQLFVADREGRVVGYAGSSQFRIKAAYDTTVETTVYLDPDCTGHGLGTLLYTQLFEALAHVDVHRMLAGITLPNEASLGLHKRFGFESAGVMHQVGHKLGRFWDVEWLERPAKLLR